MKGSDVRNAVDRAALCRRLAEGCLPWTVTQALLSLAEEYDRRAAKAAAETRNAA